MEEMLYTVKEVAKIIKCNPRNVYGLIEADILPALKLGSLKVRKESLQDFLKWCEGKDLSDLGEIKDLHSGKAEANDTNM